MEVTDDDDYDEVAMMTHMNQSNRSLNSKKQTFINQRYILFVAGQCCRRRLSSRWIA